ncbi:MAG: SatD family protein [Candidatus Heimdallarchaeota archaeon]
MSKHSKIDQLYFILTADIVHSRKVPNRLEVQQEIKRTLEYVNTKLSDQILCPFVIVWGDSFQSALTSLKGFYNIVETLEEKIPVAFRIGIGIGKISTTFSPNVMEMDGPAFHNSKLALQIAEKNNYHVWVQSGNDQVDRMVNTVLILFYVVKSRWTTHQKEIIHLRRQGMTYDAIGKVKGITKQAVNKTLKTAGWSAVSFATDSLNDVIFTFFE